MNAFVGRSKNIISTSVPPGIRLTSVCRFNFGPLFQGLSLLNMTGAVDLVSPRSTYTRYNSQGQHGAASSTRPLSRIKLFPQHFSSRRTSFKPQCPMLNQSSMRKGHRIQLCLSNPDWVGPRRTNTGTEAVIHISQHKGGVFYGQAKGQNSTFVKSKANPPNFNFNLRTSELIFVLWLTLWRTLGNPFHLVWWNSTVDGMYSSRLFQLRLLMSEARHTRTRTYKMPTPTSVSPVIFRDMRDGESVGPN